MKASFLPIIGKNRHIHVLQGKCGITAMKQLLSGIKMDIEGYVHLLENIMYIQLRDLST
jgi:hypothetical protein